MTGLLLLVSVGMYLLKVQGNGCLAGPGAPGAQNLRMDGPVENPGYPVAQPGGTSNIQDITAFAEDLWAKYQQRLQGPTASNSTVVYNCGPEQTCAGWGDRLMGMTTLFYYALLTNSQFDIVHTRPLDLATIYPLVRERRPTYSTEGAVRKTIFTIDPAPLISQDFGADIAAHPTHIINCNLFGWDYIRKNPRMAEAVAFYNLARLTKFDMFRVMMELYLSKLSPELQHLVDAELAQMSTAHQQHPTLIGVQIRNGGSWNDAIRHSTQTATQFADQALQFCKQADDKCWIYVTSDSVPAQELFVQHIKHQQPQAHITVASGEPVHVDSIDSKNLAVLLKSYVDWELLRRMDRLVISRSGFGETAAWVSTIPAKRLTPGENGTFVLYDSVIGPPIGVPWP